MKNKKFLLIVSLVLAMTMSLGGTLAYLTDTDADVNTMTLGNVDIEQHEFERIPSETDTTGYETYTETERDNGPTGYKLQAYTQKKPLVPATGKVTGYDDTKVYFAQLPDTSNLGLMDVLKGINNVQDKFVFVENKGKTDAYVRTYIAYEAGSYDYTMWDSLVMRNENSFWKVTPLEKVVAINGNNYVVVEYLYDGNQYLEDGTVKLKANGKHPNGIVHPGEYTYNNLAQIYLKSEARNEDLEALDGNQNGTYDILVLSQAVQADGFADAQTALDTAFGKSADNVAAWFSGIKAPVAVSTAEELVAAIKNGGNIVLAKDITVDKWVMFSETLSVASGNIITVDEINVTIDGNGHTLTVNSIESAGNGNRLFYDASKLNISNLTIKYADGLAGGGIGLKSGVISNVKFEGGNYAILPGNGDIKVENCTFDTNGTAIYFEEARDNLTVTGCTFNQPADKNVILLRGNVKFTNNIVNSGRTVNIVSGSPVVTGNNFNNVRLKVYSAATATISNNTINDLQFETTTYSSTFTNNTMSDAAQAALDGATQN